jgi:hypothetical protein
MQQIRIVNEATRVPNTENMRLMLSEHPDQRQLLDATAGGPALSLEGASLVFACADRTDLLECRRLIGQLIDQVNASGGST